MCLAGPYNSVQPTVNCSQTTSYVQSLMCYLQFMVNGFLIQQRAVFRLDFDQAPNMRRQFMNCCLGINGKTYEGSRIFKVLNRFNMFSNKDTYNLHHFLD